MGWSANDARREVWSERLRQFSHSGLTVAAFCQRERVSVPSFYQWRRKLTEFADGRFGTRQTQRNAQPRRSPAFVPVQIRHSAAIEIRLPNGVQVWLPAGDAAMLAAGIVAAGRLSVAGQETEAC
jgi:transposase-like protein